MYRREGKLAGRIAFSILCASRPLNCGYLPRSNIIHARVSERGLRQGQARQDTLEKTLVQEQKFVALVSPIRLSKEGLIQLPGSLAQARQARLHFIRSVPLVSKKSSQRANKKLKAIVTVGVVKHRNADAVLAHASRGISRMKRKTKPELQPTILPPHSFPQTVRCDSQRRSCRRWLSYLPARA